MLKQHIIVGWKVIIIILSMGFIAGCGQPSSVASVGVQFNNEAQLEQEGFVTKLNQEVNIGDEKVILEKLAFDRDSMVFAYKGGTIQLSGYEFNIKGLERTKSQKFTQLVTTPSFGATVGNGYHVVVVPHNLKLVNQKVSIELNINGRDNKFTINFPGDIINSSTTEAMADSNGNVVLKDTAKASYKVVVCVGYTIVESKEDSDFIVEDEKNQRIQQSSKMSTTGESLVVYGPLALPRREPSIKVYPGEKLVVVSVK